MNQRAPPRCRCWLRMAAYLMPSATQTKLTSILSQVSPHPQTMSTYTIIANTAPGRLAPIQAPIPDPTAEHVVIKVEYGAITPFDVYVVDRGFYSNYPQGIGGNVSGTVVRVGPEVTDLKVGDRVSAAIHHRTRVFTIHATGYWILLRPSRPGHPGVY